MVKQSCLPHGSQEVKRKCAKSQYPLQCHTPYDFLLGLTLKGSTTSQLSHWLVTKHSAFDVI
jgi:hypothetical protein